MMSRSFQLAVLVASILSAATWGQSVRAAPDAPDLRGTWTGSNAEGAIFGKLGHQGAAAEPKFADKALVWTLTIEKQDGRGLIGTWANKQQSEKLLGVIRQDNETVLFSDEDSFFQAKVLSPTSMEVCIQETTGHSIVATCRIFNKQ